jgi:hypothetical protein
MDNIIFILRYLFCGRNSILHGSVVLYCTVFYWSGVKEALTQVQLQDKQTTTSPLRCSRHSKRALAFPLFLGADFRVTRGISVYLFFVFMVLIDFLFMVLFVDLLRGESPVVFARHIKPQLF